jgi:hypothetical protein
MVSRRRAIRSFLQHVLSSLRQFWYILHRKRNSPSATETDDEDLKQYEAQRTWERVPFRAWRAISQGSTTFSTVQPDHRRSAQAATWIVFSL